MPFSHTFQHSKVINISKTILTHSLVIFLVIFGLTPAHSSPQKSNQDITPGNKVAFTDSFDRNTLDESSYFKYFDECAAVEENHLVLAIQKEKRCLLNIRPLVGNDAELHFSLKWPKKSSSRFQVYYDYRYTLHDEFGLIVFSSQKGKIYYRDVDRKWRSIRFRFTRDKWVPFSLVRKKSTITLYCEGKELFSTRIREKKGAKDTEEQNEYGGFGFGLDTRNFSQRIHLDNISVAGSRAPVEFDIIRKEFQLTASSYTFSVIYEKGYEDWAGKQLNTSISYMQRLADLYGVPPVQEYMGIVQARGEYYYKGYGVNAKTGIISKWPQKNRNDRIEMHELAHNWGYLYAKEWLEEGAANLPLALFDEIDAKDLMRVKYTLKKQQQRDFKNWINNIFIEDDKFGWEGSIPTDKTKKFYWKAAVLHRIIYRILGRKKYKELHEKIYARGGHIDTDDFMSIFKEITGKSAEPLLLGWVYPGTGRFNPLDTVKDNDNDGLNNLEEQLYGTDLNKSDSDNDGFSDFGEMKAGFNPLDNNEPGDQYLITDGIIHDWEKVSSLFPDARGDAANTMESRADFESIKAYGDLLNNKVYFLILYYHQLQIKQESPYRLLVQLDLDGDGRPDNRVDYRLPAKKIRFLSEPGMTGPRETTTIADRHLPAEGADIFFGNSNNQGFIEASFPLDSFTSTKGSTITMWVKGGFKEEEDAMDENPLHVQMNTLYNRTIPAQVFIPEVMY